MDHQQLYLPMNTLSDGQILGDVDGTVHGDVSLVPGVHGNALNFDGTSKWVDIGSHG